MVRGGGMGVARKRSESCEVEEEKREERENMSQDTCFRVNTIFYLSFYCLEWAVSLVK